MTLHRSVELVRKALTIVGGAFGGLILMLILYSVWINIQQSLFPKPPPPPTMKFGVLPFTGFPQNSVKTPLTYTINTISGKLPVFSDRVNVYQLAQPQPNLLGLEKVKPIAQINGFLGNPTPLSENVFMWTNATAQANLTYNILTNGFVYKTNYLHDPAVVAAKFLPNQQQPAVDFAKSAISGFIVLPAFPIDLTADTSVMSLFSVQNNTLVPAASFSQAQIVRVDFFQQNIEKTPIYYSTYPQSPIYVLIGSGDTDFKAVEVGFDYEPILTDFSATYPIITSDQAFKKLQSGQAYIARYDGTSSNVNINSVSQGYYIGNSQQAYLMPIIVFSGDNNFYAFVSAVTDKWVEVGNN